MNNVQVDSREEDLRDFMSVNEEIDCSPNILNIYSFYCKVKNLI